MPTPPIVEEFQVSGHQLLTSIKSLIHAGNIRRISIRNAKGVTLLEIPLVVGLAGAVFAPVWAAVGALAAIVGKCTLVVERVESNERASVSTPGPSKPLDSKKKAKGKKGAA